MKVSKAAVGVTLLGIWVVSLLVGAILAYPVFGVFVWWAIQMAIGGIAALLICSPGYIRILEDKDVVRRRELEEAISRATTEKFMWAEEHPNRIAMDTEIENLNGLIKSMEEEKNNNRFGKVSREVAAKVDKAIGA